MYGNILYKWSQHKKIYQVSNEYQHVEIEWDGKNSPLPFLKSL